jgi:excisionase family DNA binding protein
VIADGERGHLAEGDLLTAAQVLKILPVGKATLYALAASGELPSFRVTALGSRGGRVLFHRSDVEAFVQRARQAAPRAPVGVDADELLRRVRARRQGIGPPNGE